MVNPVNWFKQKFEFTATGMGIAMNGKVQISPVKVLIPLEKDIDSGLKKS